MRRRRRRRRRRGGGMQESKSPLSFYLATELGFISVDT